MRNTFITSVVVFTLFLSMCSQKVTDPHIDTHQKSGGVSLTIEADRIGALAKVKAINMNWLFVVMTAEGEDAIRDTFSLTGREQQSKSRIYTGMASLKEWSISVRVVDQRDSLIHSGSSTFVVPPGGNVDVSINLSSMYSMIVANYYPIRDSVDRCVLLIDDNNVADSSFVKQSLLGDTVKLSHDYVAASAEGFQHHVKMDVYGNMWGFDYLLYSGDTNIVVVSGVDTTYNITLYWVGPENPPAGQATMNVVLGKVGLIVINGELEDTSSSNTNPSQFLINGDFEDGLNGWTPYTLPHSEFYYGETIFDVTGDGISSKAVYMKGGDEWYEPWRGTTGGGGLMQEVTISTPGEYELKANVTSTRCQCGPGGYTLIGGSYQLRVDQLVVASHGFGRVNTSDGYKRATLVDTLNLSAGVHRIDIQFTESRTINTNTYADNVSLVLIN